VGNKGEGFLVSAEVNKVLGLRIFDLLITGENPETAGG
jgi:hypothetical protein